MEPKDTEQHAGLKRIRIAVELEPAIVARVDSERRRTGCSRAQYLRSLVMERVGSQKLRLAGRES